MAAPVTRLYKSYTRVSGGGANGRVVGINGSINPLAVYAMLIAMQVDGRTVFDFGCSEGRVLFAAVLLGARRAIGVDMPENRGYRFLFDAVKKSMEKASAVLSIKWIPRDIDTVERSHNCALHSHNFCVCCL
jgi:predicted RNA methylase